jgi:ankyrin repeat protein
MLIGPDEPLAVAVVDAIRDGNVEMLETQLAENPGLASARLGDGRMSRTLLHVATDWPGHFPNGAATVTVLIAAGADVNARFVGPHAETPLHWAASSDDVDVLDALIDAGADLEAPGAVIGGGSPLADATAFGQWQAARRLVERGAVTTLWQAATLGMMDRVNDDFAVGAPPTPDEVTRAFWGACHGGQRPTAEYLLDRGADPNWIGYDGLSPLDAAQRSNAGELVEWLRGQGARTAGEL